MATNGRLSEDTKRFIDAFTMAFIVVSALVCGGLGLAWVVYVSPGWIFVLLFASLFIASIGWTIYRRLALQHQGGRDAGER